MQSRILLPGQVPKRFHCLNRMEVVPFQYKSVEWQTREIKQRVPIQKTFIQMKPRVKKTKVPVERTVVDYLPVKKEIVYKPKMVVAKSWDYLPVEKTIQKVQYEEVQKTIVKKKRPLFPDSKYCRFGQTFKDKYLNDDPTYDLNALSTSEGDFEWRVNDYNYGRNSTLPEGSRIKDNTTEADYERSDRSVDFDKGQSTGLFTRSAFFSEHQRTRGAFVDYFEKDEPIQNY